MADPSDLKFSATDLKLVNYYLRNKISTGKSDFITEIKLYEEEPWLLPHVNNSQFKDNEWFYFVTRNRRARKTPKRTVPGRNGSEGGTWSTSNRKQDILDDNKIVIGHKSELAYHKKINGKTSGNTTGWRMTEYWLASENDDDIFQEEVLCYIRETHNVVDQFRFHPRINNNIVEQAPQLENIDHNINMVSDVTVPGVDSAIGLEQQQPPDLPLQDQESDQDMEKYADMVEEMLQVEDDDGDEFWFDVDRLLADFNQQPPPDSSSSSGSRKRLRHEGIC